MNSNTTQTAVATVIALASAAQPLVAQMKTTALEARPVINMLTDCSHDYSFNLSHADRNQSEIYPGITCLTSGRTIAALDLEPVNALVLLVNGLLPYIPEDAPHVLKYVREGGGLYLSVKTGGAYAASVAEFIKAFGVEDAGQTLSDKPEDWGVSAHAPSELVFETKGRFSRFTARVGAWADSSGTVAFEVYGDDKPLHRGAVLTLGARETIDVPIAGVQTLRLVATDGGDGRARDGSVWFDPRVTTPDGKSVRLLLKNAKSVKVGWADATQDRHFNGKPLGVARADDAKDDATDGMLVAADHPAAVPGLRFTKGGQTADIKLTEPGAWKTVYATEGGKPVVMARAFGKGFVVVDVRGLYYAANDKHPEAVAAVRRIVESIAVNKAAPRIKGGGGWQFSDGYRWELIHATEDGLRIHHNAYTTMYVPNDVKAYHKTVEYLAGITGLDEKHKAAQIKEGEDRRAATLAGAAIDVDVSGVKELTLVATDGGNGNGADHAVWAQPVLIGAAGARRPVRLADASSVQVGWGRPVQDRDEDGNPLSIGGRSFEQGIYLHAKSRMTIPLDGKARRFTAWAGCRDRSPGSVGFQVVGDGRILWDDGKVYNGGIPGGDPSDPNYVPPGVLFQLKYLACVGAGFLLPQGSAVDLPPELKDDWQVHLGMLAHEMGHAWSFPFCEVMGEESSAFTFNNLVLHHHFGQKHEDSVTRRLMGYLERGRELDDADLAKERNDFKYYMFIDLMIRQYGEGVWKNYNQLKYALLNKEGAVWTPHTTAWLWSLAAGEDVFPHLQTAFGSSVDPAKVELPQRAMNAGFDPVEVGRRFGVTLEKLPRKREVFGGLKNFQDVRAFYAREAAEKGHPAKEG